MVTLTSDYGTKDHYVGAFKGLLYSGKSDLIIVDISHEVQACDIAEAAFILQQAYNYFSKKTVHISLIEVEQCFPDKLVAMELDGHYFLGGDNGLFQMIRPDRKPDHIVRLEIGNHQELTTAWEVLAKTAVYLQNGGQLNVLGADYQLEQEFRTINPSVFEDGSGILGNVIYIDNFGNLITNIREKLFFEVFGTKSPTIYLSRNRKIKKISPSYFGEGLSSGDSAAIFNQSGFLEIGIVNSGGRSVNGANKLLNLSINDTIRVILE